MGLPMMEKSITTFFSRHARIVFKNDISPTDVTMLST